jgi:hypothetical protein
MAKLSLDDGGWMKDGGWWTDDGKMEGCEDSFGPGEVKGVARSSIPSRTSEPEDLICPQGVIKSQNSNEL